MGKTSHELTFVAAVASVCLRKGEKSENPMKKRIASFQLMELIEQELAYSAEAELAVTEPADEQEVTGDLSPGEGSPWRGIEDQMRNPMPRRRR